MSTFLQDIRLALRQFRRSPGFTLTAVLTLALGIGVNIVVFSVLNALVLRAGNYRDPDRVFCVQRVQQGWITLSYPRYRDFRDRNTTFESIADFHLAQVGMDTGKGAEPVWGYEASGNYFDTLGIQPALGRFYHAADEHGEGSAPYIVLSYDCWRTRFNGDRDIVGKVVRITKHPYTVLGVAPRGFYGTERFLMPEFWVPFLQLDELEGVKTLENRGWNNAWVVGRTKPGVTPAQATADLNRIARQMAKEHPTEDSGLAMKLTRPGFLGDGLSQARGFLAAVMALAGLVLLAACANLGSLSAARTSDRTREIAVRITIGCSPQKILRQLLTESIALSLTGGVVAYFFANSLLKLLSAWHPVPTIQVIVTPDWRVFVMAVSISVGTGLLFGLAPVRQILATDPNQALRSAGTTTVTDSSRWPLRDILLGVQIALCCFLVTASLVSLRGLMRAMETPLGFQPEHAVLVNLDLQLANYTPEQAEQFQKNLRNAAAALPDVRATAYADTTPLSIGQSDCSIWKDGTAEIRPETAVMDAQYYHVSPGYFSTAGTRLLAGREFTEHDDIHAPLVAVVNSYFARKLYGDATSAIGRYFLQGNMKRYQIIGVVEDGHYTSLTEEPKPARFYPILQDRDRSTALLLRTQKPAGVVVHDVGEIVRGMDSGVPITEAGAWMTELGGVLLPARAATVALGSFGVLALLLAVTGIFGMGSYVVARRMRELSIRVALGASARQVMEAALSRMFWLVTASSLVGLFLGVSGSRILAAIVYHATASDPVVMIGVVLTMTFVGLGSMAIPALRAITTDPALLLREE